MVESWPIRRLAATIPALGESVQQHAAAVVEADAARVAAAEKYRVGRSLDRVRLEGIAAQTQQTLALLDTLTDYNRSIADYVLIVLPPATPANRSCVGLGGQAIAMQCTPHAPREVGRRLALTRSVRSTLRPLHTKTMCSPCRSGRC